MHRYLRSLACLRLLLGLLALCGASAQAQGLSSVTFQPASTVIMPPTAGTVYTGSLVYQFNGPAFGAFFATFITFGSSAAPLNGLGGTATVSMRVTRPLVAADITATGTNCPYSVTGQSADYTILSLGYGTACQFLVTVPVQITKTAGTVTGTLNAISPRVAISATSCGAATTRWAMWWLVGGCGVGVSSVSGVLPYVSVACTLAVPSMTVNLPPVSRKALAAAGAVAGSTPFNITLQSCNWTNPVTPLTVTAAWNFTTLGASNIIQTGVTNVGVQILDETLTPVVNGGTRTMFSVVNGTSTYTKPYSARYIAVGGAASAGSFSGVTATFDLTYN